MSLEVVTPEDYMGDIVGDLNRRRGQILAMDSMQSVTAKDVADGTTYLSIMEENLSVLKDALK